MLMTPAQASPYFRMGERAAVMQSAVFGFAGVDGRRIQPFSPMRGKPGEQVLGEYCNGEAIDDCMAVFCCDENTLEKIACRTCPN